jgi:hypothetical protein
MRASARRVRRAYRAPRILRIEPLTPTRSPHPPSPEGGLRRTKERGEGVHRPPCGSSQLSPARGTRSPATPRRESRKRQGKLKEATKRAAPAHVMVVSRHATRRIDPFVSSRVVDETGIVLPTGRARRRALRFGGSCPAGQFFLKCDAMHRHLARAQASSAAVSGLQRSFVDEARIISGSQVLCFRAVAFSRQTAQEETLHIDFGRAASLAASAGATHPPTISAPGRPDWNGRRPRQASRYRSAVKCRLLKGGHPPDFRFKFLCPVKAC